MSQQHSLKRQKGSTLVGMLVLSSVMTFAASGYLLYTANGSKDQDLASKNLAMHYAAESGLQMGVRWMRNQYPVFYTDTWAGFFILTPGGDYVDMDGFQVKVRLDGNPIPPHIPLRTLTSWATAGTGQDTLKITWQMDAPPGADASVNTHCKPVMSSWQETLYLGKP